jgi:thiopeptide-type bacteriocin biosynthesis protein
MLDPLFIPASFFLLRTPVWPKEKAEPFLVEGSEIESLIHLYDANEQLREAIAIASPSLRDSLQKRAGKNLRQEAESLSHYVTRMATRATPFGLFACVSTGFWGESTNLFFNHFLLRKRARCDMEWIYSLVQKVYQNENIFTSLSVRTNPLAQLEAERYVLTYIRHLEKGPSPKVYSIRATKLTRYILAFAREPIEIGSLWEKIRKNIPTLEQEKTLQVIKELLSQQFLLPGILPSLLDISPFENLLEHLSPFINIKHIANEIRDYNQLCPGKGEIALEKLQKNMSAIVSSKTYLQVDTSYEKCGTLSKCVANELEKVLDLLWKVSAIRSKPSSLTAYHAKFIEKYGTDRTVPLRELLDEEKGLGTFENNSTAASMPLSSKFTLEWERWLNQKWQECIHERKKEWVLDEELFSQFLASSKQKLPNPQEFIPSLDVFFKIFADSKESIDEGKFLLMLSETTSEGGSVMGRFLDVLGEETQTKLSEFFRLEEQLEPHAVFVELSYWPTSVRSANVATQPCLRRYRLDIEAKLWQQESLSLEDIYVGATDSRLYLTLKEGGHEIITRTGNLFNNFYAPLPIKFMRHVTLSRFQSLSSFNWGNIQETALFLPRVRFQKTILSPAQWNLEARPFVNEPPEKIISLFTSWASKWDLPERFLMVHEDLQLLLNRQKPAHLDEIARKLKRGESLRLMEYIENGWIKGQEGHHFSEICVPFIKNPLYASKAKAINPPPYHYIDHEERFKLPGSEWLFIKFYLNAEKIDRFLVQHLHPFAEQLRSEAKEMQWFVVRYHDPDSHVRFRIRLSSPEIYSEILPLLEKSMKQWMTMGLLKDITFANYEREIERYGGPLLIEAAEAVFFSDTLATVSILQSLLTKQIRCDEPVLYTLCVLSFLKDCGLNWGEMLAILNEKEDQSELQGFRKHKSQLIKLVCALEQNSPAYDQPEITVLETASRWRSQEIQSFYMQSQGLETEKLYRIYDNMLHMHCNRLGCIGNKENRARLYARQILLHMKHLAKI